MIRICYENYYEYVKKNEGIIVFYGVGSIAKKYYKELGRVDLFCDKNVKSFNGVDCIQPFELNKYKEKLIILITIKKTSIVNEVIEELSEIGINADIFMLFDNPAFKWFDFETNVRKQQFKESLKINIIYNNDGWIFGKFANNLKDELQNMGQDVYISEAYDPTADVNHFIPYLILDSFISNDNSITTTMITHVDCNTKLERIRFHAENGAYGICMSKDTLNKLTMWGVERAKLCYINPAQDGIIKPRKIILGITNRCYGGIDLRKRDDIIFEVCKYLNPDMFEIRIMGSGWDAIVKKIQEMGFEVIYYRDFIREKYIKLMAELDYWIYYGFDEGAMGYLDAMAAGIKTIVTPQGYHLDTSVKPTYLCETVNDFINTLLSIQNEKLSITNSVKEWTWDNYAKKHLEVWQYLCGTKSLAMLYSKQNEYLDGIYSMLPYTNVVK